MNSNVINNTMVNCIEILSTPINLLKQLCRRVYFYSRVIGRNMKSVIPTYIIRLLNTTSFSTVIIFSAIAATGYSIGTTKKMFGAQTFFIQGNYTRYPETVAGYSRKAGEAVSRTLEAIPVGVTAERIGAEGTGSDGEQHDPPLFYSHSIGAREKDYPLKYVIPFFTKVGNRGYKGTSKEKSMFAPAAVGGNR